ncbi:hypothetical protein EDD21DRAFT_31980 [Dissophora ornata]|nr:hypothetical protein EDD21DRAFT_31980 [Dissophora ornata]
MVASSSVPNSNPTVDWADDTDEEIDFGAPVFSDDEDLPRPEVTTQSQEQTITSSSDTIRSTDVNKSAPFSSPPQRYTAGFADGSNRSLDRRSQNDSSLQPMSSRVRARENPSSRRDTSASRPSSNHQWAGRGPGGSFEREGHWKSDGRRDPSAGGSFTSHGSPQADGGARWSKHSEHGGLMSGQRSPRQVIPLPPKPAAALDANNRPRIDRSRSPSFRSHSPLPGTGRRWDDARQRPMSPYSDYNTPLASNTHSSGHSTRPQSPQRHLRAHMDQVSQTRDHSTRQPRDHAPEGRWEKTPHEDKPYPSLPPPTASESPKDDVIYFRRREGRVNDSPNQDRPPSGMMYHERLEVNDPRHRRPERSDTTNDRWEKNHVVGHDKPYPERSHPGLGGRGGHEKHTRTRSRGQVDLTTVVPSPPHEKSSRASRGKGKDQQNRRSKDRPALNVDDNEMQDKDQGAAVPWWENSTYGVKKKEDQPPQEQTESAASTTTTAPASTASTASSANKPANVKEASTTSSGTNEAVPWWETSTYKVKPKGDLADQGNSQLTTGDPKSAASASPSPVHRDSQSDAETLARRKALGQTNLISGVEALTLVSRGEDDSG